MNLAVELDHDFETTLQELKRNYDYSFMKIVGFKPQQMSFTTYIKDFVEAKNQSDNSIDGTSNSDKRDVVALLSDIDKPILKLTAFNHIFTKIKEKYGLDTAKQWLKSEYLGFSYLHDAHMASLIPYCYAYDLTRLANEGLFFIAESHQNSSLEPYNAEPTNHLDVFINLVKEFVSWCCNRQSGAVGLPNLIPYLYYFWKKDIESKYNGCSFQKDKNGNLLTGIENYPNVSNNQNVRYLKQQIQALIYALNQPFLRGGIQSAFTNVSIFDHEYAHALFDGMVFPDNSLAFDEIDNIIILEKIFMDVIADIRNKNMFTFPVLSYSLLTKKLKNIWIKDNGEQATEKELKEYFKDLEEGKENKSIVFNYDLFINRDYAEQAKEYCIENKRRYFTKFVDESFAHWASDHNTKWMDSNFFMDDSITSLSNCCRLKSNITDLGYFNSVGGTALSVGSIKVNTVNLARLAYETLTENNFNYSNNTNDIIDEFISNLKNEYLNKLEKQVILNLKCLDTIRDTIKKNIKKNLLPNICEDGLIDLNHMYNTVGFIGIYETLKAFQNRLNEIKNLLGIESSKYDFITVDSFGNHYYTSRAEQFVKEIFEKMQKVFADFRSDYNVDYAINCEQIPGESAADKLKKKIH